MDTIEPLPEEKKDIQQRGTYPLMLVVFLIVVSSIGLADASYLSSRHITAGSGLVNCGFTGCDVVLNSAYAYLLGIPVAFTGVLYYASIFFSCIAYLASGKKGILTAVGYATIIGILASLYFVYLQIFVIKALCPYCMVSAGTSLILFILGTWIIRKHEASLKQTIV